MEDSNQIQSIGHLGNQSSSISASRGGMEFRPYTVQEVANKLSPLATGYIPRFLTMGLSTIFEAASANARGMDIRNLSIFNSMQLDLIHLPFLPTPYVALGGKGKSDNKGRN